MIENEETLVELLKKAKEFNIVYNDEKPNFLSITNFPRYENVVSDILKFYFDTKEEHNLKDLWLNCLIECYNNNVEPERKINYHILNVEEIIREQSTDEHKRIDLFIVTRENIVIIENKIDSSLNNDLEKYNKKAEEYCREYFNVTNDDEIKSHIIPILLTMREEKDEKGIFINILYKDLIEKIKQKIGSYINEANTKWLIYMNEFINNLEEINRGYQMSSIDIDFQQFLKDNEDDVRYFLTNLLKGDIDSKIGFFKAVDKKIDDTISQNKKGVYTYMCNKFDGYISLYVDIETKNGTIAIEPYISRNEPDIIQFTIWKRGKEDYIWNKELEALKEIGKSCKEEEDDSWGKVLRVGEYRFSSGEITVENFANEIIEVFNKLKKLYEIE